MARAEQRVLVVDDEPKIAEVVGSYLKLSGYVPITAESGSEALALFESQHPCLVILDLMLPDLTGEELCRRLRARSRVPIIMLTAKVEDRDAIGGLALGADDYVTKPFSPRQLMARVGAVLRRAAPQGAPLARSLSFCRDDLYIDVEKQEVLKQGEPVPLTPSELQVLLVLSAHPGRVFSREELIKRALGEDFDGFDRTVDAHVKNLRQKIETDPRTPCYIVTVHGMGYRFNEAGVP
jgi:DNA-binding response OmpR family regulator